jgi:hypothetical protein
MFRRFRFLFFGTRQTMCSLCGVLGGKVHWTEELRPVDPSTNVNLRPTRLRERQERVRLLNLVLKPYGLTLDDWAGTSYIVRTRTGQSALVDHLTQLWATAERLQRRPCDPLDTDLLQSLSRSDASLRPER